MITIRTPRRRVSAWLEAEASHALVRLEVALPLDPERHLALPLHRAVVAIGGATLGGSGRTPLAIALARALAPHHRVAFVGHAYGARPRHAREVDVGDRLDEVGDEALIAAEALRGLVTVHVAPTRSEALSHAAESAEVLVVDRLLQTRPVRVSCSYLAVDAVRPWGSGSVVPFGDLVATPERLRGAADELVAIGGDDAAVRITLERAPSSRERVGLVTASARPERVITGLATLGFSPALHVELADHARPDVRRLRHLAREHALDAWLVDAKTRVHLARMPRSCDAGVPLVTIRHALELSADIVSRTRQAIERTLESGRARC